MGVLLPLLTFGPFFLCQLTRQQVTAVIPEKSPSQSIPLIAASSSAPLLLPPTHQASVPKPQQSLLMLRMGWKSRGAKLEVTAGRPHRFAAPPG